MNEEIEQIKEEFRVREVNAQRALERRIARVSVANMYNAERERVNVWLRENSYPESTISELSIGKKLMEIINRKHPDLAKHYTNAVSIINTAKRKSVLAMKAEEACTHENTENE